MRATSRVDFMLSFVGLRVCVKFIRSFSEHRSVDKEMAVQAKGAFRFGILQAYTQ